MFEQFVMYWLLWLLWILVFFFMEQGIKRTALSVWLLSVISLSSVYINAGQVQVSVSMVIILFGAIIFIVEYSYSFIQLLRAFTIMIAYCAFMIWQLISPIWFFLSGYFMIPVLIVLIGVFISRKIDHVFSFVLLGITLGQLLFDLLLSTYHLQNTIGTNFYFIHISLVVILLMTIRTCFVLWEQVSGYLVRKLT